MSTTTNKLGLIKPSIADEIHQTIYDLANNFQTLDDVSEVFLNAPPTSGYWQRSQKVWNKEPSIGTTLGWVNVREGTASPIWSNLKSFTVGDVISPSVNNGHYYKCIQSGYSGVNEPVFPVSEGGTVEDVFGKATWQAGVNRQHNSIVVPTFSNNRFYVCTVAGQSGTSEPNWSLVDGGTTTDGSAVWTGYRICVWQEEGVSAHFRPFGQIG